MSLYAISDLHLSFADTIEKPMDVFGPEWENHAERLRAAWIRLVKDEDTVVIPGDISWGMSLEEAKPDLAFIDALPGKKVLLRGNHDYWWASMKKMRGLFKSIEFIQNDAYEGDNFVICGCRGWYFPGTAPKDMTIEESEKIYRRELLRMEMSIEAAKKLGTNKEIIVATHYPPIDKFHVSTEFSNLFDRMGIKKVIYGHLHGKRVETALEGEIDGIYYTLVSLDRLDATPKIII